jgi:hypothetical protein
MIGFSTAHYLSVAAGTVVLVIWTAALAGIALALLRGRDIN